MKTPQNWKPGTLLRKGVCAIGAALVAGAVCAADLVTYEASDTSASCRAGSCSTGIFCSGPVFLEAAAEFVV